jgi:hypothetical protein
MSNKVVLVQKNRQVVKRIGTSYAYETSFGTFGTAKADTTGFDNPAGIAKDASNFLYICDSKNKRIIKLTSAFAYSTSFDVSTTVGKPYAIMFDPTSSDLYVAGIYDNYEVSVARITTAGATTRSTSNVYSGQKDIVYAITKGFGTNEFIIALGTKLISITEVLSGSSFVASTAVSSEQIVATLQEAVENKMHYLLAHSYVVAGSYTLYRTSTETLTYTNGTNYQSSRYPIIGTADTNFVVYKNGTQTSAYTVTNQATGSIALNTPASITDVIKIRYRFLMIENTDYVIKKQNAALDLTRAVNYDPVVCLSDLVKGDKIEVAYSYNTPGNVQPITGENAEFNQSITLFTGATMNSGKTALYLTAVKDNVGKIVKVGSSYINIGDSDKIAKGITTISQSIDGLTLLTYDRQNRKVVRYDTNLNKVEDVYVDSFANPAVIATDAYEH